MKFGFSEYWKPTPKKIRKIADAILAAVTFAAPISVLNGYPIVGTVLFVLGVLAKFVSNFWGADTDDAVNTPAPVISAPIQEISAPADPAADQTIQNVQPS